MMLAPLLQGNTRTIVLLFLQDLEAQYKACKHALNSYKDIGDIVSACFKEKLIDKESLGMTPPDISESF